jgi:hypothetical protein
MTVDDSDEFFRRLVALAEIFDLKLSPQRQALYFQALRDLPFAAVTEAMNTAARACTFFPKPAELRMLAIGDTEDQVEVAWIGLRKALASLGAYASFATSNAALAETIVSVFGGWPQACSADLSPEMWAAKRKEFGRVYRVFVGRQLEGPRYLPGLTEQQNAGRLNWEKYVSVGLLDGDVVRALPPHEADTYRAVLSGQAHGLARLSASMSPDVKGRSA